MIALTRSCARGAAAASNAATATANALPGVRVAPSPLLLRRRGAAIIRTTGVDRSMSSGTATAAAAVPPHIAAASHFDEDALQGPARVFAASLRTILERYWAESPTAARVIADVFAGGAAALGADQVFHDHVALRTFGLPGLGIDAVGAALEAFGYARRDASAFPAKKLTAAWFAPPPLRPGGAPAYEALPRVFVSQLEVGRLSPSGQAIILRATAGLAGGFGAVPAWAAIAAGARPWAAPSEGDYDALLAESEYAAWVLANGFALNHTALALHRVAPRVRGGLAALNARLEAAGFTLNAEGGAIKASPDGLLLQSSTVADVGAVEFAGGVRRMVPRAYLEFVERRPLPAHLRPPLAVAGADGGGGGGGGDNEEDNVPEVWRRDGFEAASANNIFASTTLAATAMAAAGGGPAAAAADGGSGGGS